ncbi:TrmB family transcriptional regulator [Patescibacteria group bacterium]
MEIPHILQQLGFSDKEIKVYLTLLTGGPSSVRKLAKDADLNRGTVYDILKSLQVRGLVGMYQKHKKQFFMAEDPDVLLDTIDQQERKVSSLKRDMADILPELRSLYVHGGSKPVVKYYEGEKGVSIILRDVLTTMHANLEKTYSVYSSMSLREYLYKEFPHFTRERIERRIHVNVIAVGAGGEEQPYSERRWLTQEAGSPTYSIIYGPKVAFFSLDKNDNPIGVLIEDERIAATERMIFNHVWRTIGVEVKQKSEKVKARNV